MALETFKAQLKAKAKTLGAPNLSNKRIDAYAAVLEKQNPNLATDDDHAEKLDAFLELVDLKEIAAYDDRTRSQQNKDKQQPNKDKPADEPADPAKDEPVDDPNEPAYVKALRKQNETILARLEKIDEKEKAQSIDDKLKSHVKLKGIPQGFWNKRQKPTKDEDVDAWVDEAAQDWESLAPESGAGRPQQAAGGSSKQPSSEEVKQLEQAFK